MIWNAGEGKWAALSHMHTLCSASEADVTESKKNRVVRRQAVKAKWICNSITENELDQGHPRRTNINADYKGTNR